MLLCVQSLIVFLILICQCNMCIVFYLAWCLHLWGYIGQLCSFSVVFVRCLIGATVLPVRSKHIFFVWHCNCSLLGTHGDSVAHYTIYTTCKLRFSAAREPQKRVPRLGREVVEVRWELWGPCYLLKTLLMGLRMSKVAAYYESCLAFLIHFVYPKHSQWRYLGEIIASQPKN